MTSDSTGSLDDRLAQLAARRAAAGGRAKPLAQHAADPNEDAPRRNKRAHPAATGRVLAASLSTSAFLSIVTALSAQSAPSGAATVKFTNAAPPRPPTRATTPTTIVVRTVHHTVYVDANGNPVAVLPVPATGTAGTHPMAATVPQRTTYGSRYTYSAPRGTTYAPVYHAPTPVYAPPSQPGTHPAPVPAPAPAPTTPKAPAPTPTAPPTTAYHAPAPPPPPACTGSKCP